MVQNSATFHSQGSGRQSIPLTTGIPGRMIPIAPKAFQQENVIVSPGDRSPAPDQ